MTAEFKPEDYSLVPNQELVLFLEDYELIIQQNPHPVAVLGYRFEQLQDVGIPLVSHSTRIANTLRKLGIIEAEQFDIKKGRVNYHVLMFNLWERRALASFYWTYQKALPFQRETFLRDFPERITMLREALGSHPLASYIHDPMPVEVDHHISSSPKKSRGIIFIEQVHQDPDKKTLGSSLQPFRSEEFVDPAQLGLTDYQIREIVRLATSGKGHVIDNERGISVSQLNACLETLLRHPPKT